jgi:hypothetical protein
LKLLVRLGVGVRKKVLMPKPRTRIRAMPKVSVASLPNIFFNLL